MKDGMIFNIQRFSINDGPGIRTTVFFKGCPLRCLWCHNPESYDRAPEILYQAARCIGCGRCADVCTRHCHTFSGGLHRFDREGCIACGACAQVCCGALSLAGEKMSVEQVVASVLRDEPFYQNSGGGVTLSGGEPLYQPDFLLDLLIALKKRRLHTCLETSGCAPYAHLEAAAAYVDLFLYDYKETNGELHRSFTGVSNEQILDNLERLDARGASIVLRCPIIPGFNDRDDHFAGIAAVANRLRNIREINIMPYHPLGRSKNAQLGREDQLKDVPFPDKSIVGGWIRAVAERTDRPVRED